MDRDPLVLLELGRRVELSARERGRRSGEREDRAQPEQTETCHQPRRPEVADEREPELERICERVRQRRRDREMRAGCERGDEHHEQADRLEEETESLHAGGGEITGA